MGRANITTELGTGYTNYSLLGLIHVWMGTTWMEQGYISRVGPMSGRTVFVTALLATLTVHCSLADHSPPIQENDGEDDITEIVPLLMESSQHIEKRAPYEFGIGKRFPFNSEVGKRAPYEFGIGKREPYEFGIGKRSIYDYAFDQHNKRMPYSFGVGKRGLVSPMV